MNVILTLIPFFILVYGAYWDFRKRIIPNSVPILLIILGVLQCCILNTNNIALGDRIAGIILPAILLFGLYIFNSNGLGGGDYKLLIAMGWLLGLAGFIKLMLVSCILSIVYCVIHKTKTVPFAVPIFISYSYLICFNYIV
ncbi:A24 family peptidase [Sinanaerobacter sp. ZZT-01]|uniref:A24 family peptidase n=1 Tax=Sinanaerobacter sp. ZZT-01 TaxID=3111540 RepID=UPI002D7A1D35|nr:A24 family peptidase [Sinanaerobacter sp. ZZT-01]WRR94169.1 A24 family peptidase [Sinanaerobacter sp. ZZT-01]